MPSFPEWFAKVTQKPGQSSRLPFPYQERLATTDGFPLLLRVPTGAGKTAAIALSWLWRRRYADKTVQQQTPRRLIYCLPMRTLVEQTFDEIAFWLQNAELSDIGLYKLMGGAVSDSWDMHPEQDCILIGTQDQLLSRSLNRGYSMSRYRWAMHFAFLNNDCLWVMDEVQLMGAGLKTTAQLQGFREHFQTYGPTRSLWMSATLNPELLETADYDPDFGCIHQLDEDDLKHPILERRMRSRKVLVKAETVCTGKEEDYAKALAKEVVKTHTPGELTIVVCNRVNRAQALYNALKRQGDVDLLLVHSRFRASDRQRLNQALKDGVKGILITTQALEAGVDISATILFTELAPWSSLVQRFGRCNRYGESSERATVYWIDIPDLKKGASPYEMDVLEEARGILASLSEVGPETLESIAASPPREEGLVPRKHDLLQLFDTSTDLAGHDIDVSSFIRETDESDVAIAWRDWSEDEPPNSMSALQRDELCRVSLYRAKDLLEQLKKQRRYAWVWDRLQGTWVEARTIYPGITLLLHCSDGGYSQELGFTGNPKDKPQPYAIETFIEQDQDDADPLAAIGQFITLAQHSQEVAQAVEQLCQELATYDLPAKLLVEAGRWHDAGKAHPLFQGKLTHNRPDRVGDTLWAKSDHNYRNPDDRYPTPSERRGFRHELVSALLALQEDKEFLLCYLVACHHGKVRMTIQPRPNEKRPDGVELYALGVHHGDRVPDSLPKIDLGAGVPPIQQKQLSLECMRLGQQSPTTQSWAAQAIALLDQYGPFKLAFLETLIRVADRRVSARVEEIYE